MTGQNRLVEILQAEYCDEAKDVMQITHHAQYMYYPHFREKLLRIAAEEAEHVRWFAEKIRELGGELPQVAFSPKLGKNSWECLRMILDEEKQDRQDMLQRMRKSSASILSLPRSYVVFAPKNGTITRRFST